MAFHFERHQALKFLIIDGDGTAQYETIGEIKVDLGTLMACKETAYEAWLQENG